MSSTKIIMSRNNYKLRFFAAVCLLLCWFLPATAQRPVVSVEIDTSGETDNYGPNRGFYMHGYTQLGLYTGPYDAGLKTNWWAGALNYGIRSKIKLATWESLIFDVAYRYDRFSINQKQTKAMPLGPAQHQRERISVHNLGGAFCNRINFNRRGNVLGYWLDFGVYGDWSFRTTNVYLDQHYDSNSPSGYRYKNKTKISRLPYINNLNYGFTVRTGWEYAGVFANYRVSDLIKDSSTANYGDLPRLLIGIEFYTRED